MKKKQVRKEKKPVTKQEMTVESEPLSTREKTEIFHLDYDFGNGDLNVLKNKLNEVITFINER